MKKRLNDLVADSLVYCKKYKFDVYNALSLMDNALFLEDQKFGAGDGQLHYYLFNYRANPIAGGVDQRNRLDTQGLSGIGYVVSCPAILSPPQLLTNFAEKHRFEYPDVNRSLEETNCKPTYKPFRTQYININHTVG